MPTHLDHLWDRWREPLLELGVRIRDVARASLADATDGGAALRAVHGRGEGDWTFGLDVEPEREVARWHAEHARHAPLSVFTEDAGWRHLGPGPGGASVELPPFPAGAPRVVIDPIDGTRPLMNRLASAWASLALAVGDGPPSSADVVGGVLVEIPPPGHDDASAIVAGPAGPPLEARARTDRPFGAFAPLLVDHDDRVDHGFFPVVRYHPLQRADLARWEEAFWRRVAEHEGARLEVVWDDQVVSNVAQLVAVLRGRYRSCIDARADLNRLRGDAHTTSKPYDVAAALHVARVGGVALEGADGEPLAFPLDATTPVHFAAYHNAATRARLAPHWLAARAELFG